MPFSNRRVPLAVPFMLAPLMLATVPAAQAEDALTLKPTGRWRAKSASSL